MRVVPTISTGHRPCFELHAENDLEASLLVAVEQGVLSGQYEIRVFSPDRSARRMGLVVLPKGPNAVLSTEPPGDDVVLPAAENSRLPDEWNEAVSACAEVVRRHAETYKVGSSSHRALRHSAEALYTLKKGAPTEPRDGGRS